MVYDRVKLIQEYKLGPHSRLWDDSVFEKLLNADWLIDMHVVQCYSIGELSKIIGVAQCTIRKFLKIHNIVSPSQQNLRDASNLRKYGVKNSGQVPGSREKATNTMETKFGGHNWSKASGRRYISENTILLKYGDTNIGRTLYAKEKAANTNLIKYGRICHTMQHLTDGTLDLLNSPTWLEEQHGNKKKSLSHIASDLGMNHMSTVKRYLDINNIKQHYYFSSQQEKEVNVFLSEYVLTQQNVRNLIQPCELDIYLPDYNIAIEYCGLYWHCDKFKSITYHYDKYNACKNKNIRLITIFEDEWLGKKEIVKNKLLNIINKSTEQRIFARKCQIKIVKPKEKKIFYDKYHIQGNGSGSLTYGLYYENQLVSCMTFIVAQNNIYELNRYATSCQVVGGFSKLLKYFEETNEWKQIVSFADLRWSVGNLYEINDFRLTHITKPTYEYIINNKRVHRSNFMRKHLHKWLGDKFDPNLTEFQNMDNFGINRIYNCGLLKYIKIKGTPNGLR